MGATGTEEGGECSTGANAEGITTGRALGDPRPVPKLGRTTTRSGCGNRMTGCVTLELALRGLLINEITGCLSPNSLHPLRVTKC